MKKTSIISLALTAICAFSCAWGAVVISGTRVVYPANNRDVTVRLTNNGEAPALVQSWVDAGDQTVKLEELDVPFSVSPSIFRLDPSKTQVMRLAFLGADLPKDRESIYWLNVLEIPPKPPASMGENYLQFAIKTRLKIFYRPSVLKEPPVTALGSLKWSRTASGPSEVLIKVENPSPFHVSFAEVRAQLPDGTALAPLSGMVAPFDALTLKFTTADQSMTNPIGLVYKTVDDYGSLIDGIADLR